LWRILIYLDLKSSGFSLRKFEVHSVDPLRIDKRAEEEALIFFFLTLFARLQSLGTAPAIDVSEYAKVLN
jgi:hypothetical protein